jgi:hypothetical protein
MKKNIILVCLLSFGIVSGAFASETIFLDCNINTSEEIGAGTKNKQNLEPHYSISLKRHNLIAPFSEVSFESAGKGQVIVRKSLRLSRRAITFSKDVEIVGEESGARLHFKIFRNGDNNANFKLRVAQRNKSIILSPIVDTFKNNGAVYKCNAKLLLN